MAGTLSSNDDDVISGINVTPLVDIVLVLLVVFMITAPVIYQSAIKVQLPSAHSGAQSQKSPIQFTLDKEGKVYWDQVEMDWPALEAKLKTLDAGKKEEPAMISADQATPHGVVVRLMDTLQQAGLTRFALNVKKTGK
ncbi:MAG: ExbD/TolR family protein [Bacteriovoracia bacterium]